MLEDLNIRPVATATTRPVVASYFARMAPRRRWQRHRPRPRCGLGSVAAAGCLVTLVVTACRPTWLGERIVTGPAAAGAFVFRGRPIHPFCVLFSEEESSRHAPVPLATCAKGNAIFGPADAAAPIEQHDDGWMWATNRDTRVYSGYRVLARKNDRFLLALEWSGGGTGRFTDLAWVRLDPTSLADVNDVLGGDRCGGGQSAFRVEGRRVFFKADLTTVDVLRLSDVTVPDTVRAMLDSGYFPCYGYVNYVYDVLAEQLRLESLTLRPDTQPAAREIFRAHTGSQACFDELVGEVREPLQPSEIAAFGRRFISRCVRTGGRNDSAAGRGPRLREDPGP